MNESPDNYDDENNKADDCDEVRKEARALFFDDRRLVVCHKFC